MFTSSSADADKPVRRAASRQMEQFLNGHGDHNYAILLVIRHSVARIDIAYSYTKFDDFRFSCSSDDWSP